MSLRWYLGMTVGLWLLAVELVMVVQVALVWWLTR